ncbi:MAG: helix-turn-helix transcriptional regulator [Erythrobacter sp.]
MTRDTSDGAMSRYFTQIDAATDIGHVLRLVRDVCIENDVIRMSYHVTPLFSEPTSLSTAVYAHGFSKEWLDLYDRADFRSADPIPRRVMEHGALMTWREAMEAGPNSPEHLEYFAAMREHGLEHGFGLPLFGPRGRDAYAAIDFDRPLEEVDGELVDSVRAVAQSGHQRICLLLEETGEMPRLSEREIEVLSWAARGKSTNAIATILDLSPDTVKTYAKRIYAKLDATDRVGAVIKALRLGVVKV